MNARTAVCTIVSKNYLPYARTLMASLATAEPGWDRFVLLVDRLEGAIDPSAEGYTLVEIEALPIPEKKRMLFHYGVLEMNTAAKPWFLDWLSGTLGYARVVYLDPDITVYAPMTAVTNALDEGALAVLTPHLTGRLRDGRRPAEIDILRAGTYNLGFIALSAHPSLRPLLDYWQDKSVSEFAIEPDSGIFTDQKWIDLVPGLFEDVRILRDEGYNVAYWNLAHRAVRWTGQGWRVNGVQLVFFHFSGLDPASPASLSKHQDRFVLESIGEARELVVQYSATMLRHGYETCRRWLYAFGFFDDGTRIPDAFRIAFRRIAELQRMAGDDPFAAGPELFNRAWVEGDSAPTLTWAMRAAWESKKGLQADFPDPAGADRSRLHAWFVRHAARELDMPEVFIPGPWEPSPREQAFTNKAEHARPALASRRGFHGQGAADRAAGLVWMSNVGELPLEEAAGKSGCVRGVHRADLFDQAGLDRRLDLRAEIAGRVVGSVSVAQSGPFTLEFRVPESCGRRAILRLVASQAFVPAEAGISPDPRVLAVQVRSIELDGRIAFGPEPLSTPPAAAGGSRRLFGNFSGFYPRDGAAVKEGAAWMGPEVRVRMPPLAAGARISIVGHYSPEGMVLSYGSGRLRVDVALDGQRIYRAAFEAAGDFRIEATVPEHPAGDGRRQRVLSLGADRHFVPARVGMNQDVRALVARIRRIEIDGEAILDFGSADPWLQRGQPAQPDSLGINIIGYARADSGLGQSARGAAASCETVGIPSTLFDFRDGLGPGDGQVHPVNLFHVNADQMALVAQMLGGSVLDGRYNIGCWHWELPEFPDDWLPGFDALDEIWAPSRFIMGSVAAKSPVPVAYLPHGVEFAVRPGAQRSHFGLPEGKFLFLMMYDTRSYQERKNPEGVLDAWLRAFPDGHPGVELVIKTTYPEVDPTGYARLRERVANMANVRLLAERYDRQTTYDLHALVDCYVQLHRSEGWGLNLSESMYLGKPVIGTNWSGNTEFMNPGNSCAVDYRLVQLDEDYGPYRKGQTWADPDIGHAAWFMKKLVDDPAFARDIGLRGQATIRQDFSLRAAGAQYRKRLEIIRRLI